MLFSVITVCKNDQEGLALTEESLRKQTFRDYEWIVVDGNSSDGTVPWLKSLDFPELNWVSEPDKGIFDAMNKGLAKARGKYLVFMNSNDEFESPSVLEKIAGAIEKAEVKPDIIYGDVIDVVDNTRSYYKKAKNYSSLWKGMFTSHQAMFFRNIQEINFPPEYHIAADYAYIALHIRQSDAKHIMYLDIPFCRFKLGGINEEQRFRALKEDYRIRREIMGLSFLKTSTLYMLHFGHTLLKKSLPSLYRNFRYDEAIVRA